MGQGKSTTIKILSGILHPDSGECTVNGLVPWENRKQHVSRLGVVFGQRSQLWWDVPVMDSFLLLRDIYRVEDKLFQENLDRLAELLELGDPAEKPCPDAVSWPADALRDRRGAASQPRCAVSG